jgi:hypothetical protein
MGKSSGTQTSTTTKELDPDVKAAMMDLWNAGKGVPWEFDWRASFSCCGVYARPALRAGRRPVPAS